jgi:hypothetical protein
MLCCGSDTLFFGMMTSFKYSSFDKSSICSSSCSWIITFGVVIVTGRVLFKVFPDLNYISCMEMGFMV